MRIGLLGIYGLGLLELKFNGGINMLSNQEIEKGIREWSRKLGIGSYWKPVHGGDSRELVVYGVYYDRRMGTFIVDYSIINTFIPNGKPLEETMTVYKFTDGRFKKVRG